MSKTTFILSIALWSISWGVFAQIKTISLEDAVSIALQKNHGIVSTKINRLISANNVSIGNAGLLPQIGVTAGASGGVTNSTTEFAGNAIPVLEVAGAQQLNSNASLFMNYTLFSGFKGRNTYAKFKNASDLSEIQTQLEIENTLMKVINNYYQIADFQTQLQITEQALAISKERYNRIKGKFDFGSANKLAVLNALVDYNTDSVNVLNTKLNVEMAIRDLTFLLGDDSDELFKVDTAVTFSMNFSLEDLTKKSIENNSSLLVAMHTLSLSEKELKIVQAAKYPIIALNSSYSYNQNSNTGSFVSNSNSNGFSGGISLSYNLFNGSQANINAQNAKIKLETDTEKKEEAAHLLTKELRNLHAKYQTQLQIVSIEKINVATAQLNFERSLVAFNLGQLTATEFRDAQLNLIRSKIRVDSAKFNAKRSEMDLLRLAGMLLKS